MNLDNLVECFDCFLLFVFLVSGKVIHPSVWDAGVFFN